VADGPPTVPIEQISADIAKAEAQLRPVDPKAMVVMLYQTVASFFSRAGESQLPLKLSFDASVPPSVGSDGEKFLYRGTRF
jgi:hypothetical protein